MYSHESPHGHTGAGSNWWIKNQLSVLLENVHYSFFSPNFHPLLLLTLHSLQEKEVRKWKEELLEQRRRMMEEKLLHAEFKRELQLQAIVKKAQEEEAKVEEESPCKAETIHV